QAAARWLRARRRRPPPRLFTGLRAAGTCLAIQAITAVGDVDPAEEHVQHRFESPMGVDGFCSATRCSGPSSSTRRRTRWPRSGVVAALGRGDERRGLPANLPGHRDPCLRTARHRRVVRPIARAVVPVGRRRGGVGVGGWVVVRREVERGADEYPAVTPSVEIMAAVEAVAPFESMMAFEVPAGGMSRESMAAGPRGGIAG